MTRAWLADKIEVTHTSILKRSLQVIAVDHADSKGEEFRKYICENWRLVDKNIIHMIGTNS